VLTPALAPVVPVFAVGLDIGGTKTEGVVVDADGAVLASLVRATPYGAAAVVEA
jgi:predicted NBD/HSP70 family sugar kinase